jgi:hypothetical protein
MLVAPWVQTVSSPKWVIDSCSSCDKMKFSLRSSKLPLEAIR